MVGGYITRRVSLLLCLDRLCWSAFGFGQGNSSGAFPGVGMSHSEGGGFLEESEF